MFESPGSGFELMYERVCGILCLLLAPTGHLAMVILIKVVQMFIFLNAFSQVGGKSVQFKCMGTCAQTLQRETQS